MFSGLGMSPGMTGVTGNTGVGMGAPMGGGRLASGQSASTWGSQMANSGLPMGQAGVMPSQGLGPGAMMGTNVQVGGGFGGMGMAGQMQQGNQPQKDSRQSAGDPFLDLLR